MSGAPARPFDWRSWLVWGAAAAGLIAAIVIFRAGVLAICLYALAGVVLAARVMIGFWSGSLKVERTLSDEVVDVGRHVKVVVKLTNARKWPVLWLYAEETLPAGMPVDGTTRRLLFLPAGRSFYLHYRFTPTRRGCHQLGPLVIETGDVFGLFRKTRLDARRDWVTALPEVTEIAEFRPGERRQLGNLATQRSLFEDTATIRGIREYRRGDALKRVHWKASARTGKLHTKIYDPIIEAGATVVLDFNLGRWKEAAAVASAKLGPPEERAVEVAASVGRFLSDGGWKLGFFSNGRDPMGRPGMSAMQARVVGEEVGSMAEALAVARGPGGGLGRDPRLAPISIPARRGHDQYRLILENLGRIELSDGLAIEELLPLELAHIPREQALVVIAGAAGPAFCDMMLRAQALGHRVMVMIVGNPQAHDLAFEALIPGGIEVYRMDEEWRLQEVAIGRGNY